MTCDVADDAPARGRRRGPAAPRAVQPRAQRRAGDAGRAAQRARRGRSAAHGDASCRAGSRSTGGRGGDPRDRRRARHPARVRDRLFDPFFTTQAGRQRPRARRSCTARSRRTAASCSWSSGERGTRFTMLLPRACAVPPSAALARPSEPPNARTASPDLHAPADAAAYTDSRPTATDAPTRPRRRRRDRRSSTRSASCSRTRASRRTPRTAASGARALAERAPDIVLTDVRMPDVDGLQVLARGAPARPGHAGDPDDRAGDAAERDAGGERGRVLLHPEAVPQRRAGGDPAPRGRAPQRCASRTSSLKQEIQRRERARRGAPDRARASAWLRRAAAGGDGRADRFARCSSRARAAPARKSSRATSTTLSARTERPFLSINCGALPESAARERAVRPREGLFTGAVKDKAGLFAAAGERHVLPRRDRRDDAGDAGEAAARAAAARSHPGRRDRGGADRRAPRRRHQPRPRGGDQARRLPQRTSTTASTSSRCTCRRCAQRARRHPAAGRRRSSARIGRRSAARSR